MFQQLHAMAKAATLLITASAEGDMLRVSVTPTYPGGKVPAGAALLRPLSVVGSPDELDADFAAVLAYWQAPKKSLIEQAQAAADDADDGAPGKVAAKPAEQKPAEQKPKAKPGRKPGAAAAPKPEVTEEADAGAGPAAAGGVEEFALTPAEIPADAAPAAEPAPEPEPVAVAKVDTFTVDLF